MLKKFLVSLIAVLFSTALFARTQVVLMPRTVIHVNYGDSFLELPARYPAANSIQARYWQSPYCPVAPQVSFQVRYVGNQNWHNLTVGADGAFRHSGMRLEAVRVLFKQYQYQRVSCDIEVIGFEGE